MPGHFGEQIKPKHICTPMASKVDTHVGASFPFSTCGGPISLRSRYPWEGLTPTLRCSMSHPALASSGRWASERASPEEGMCVHTHSKLPSVRGVQRAPELASLNWREAHSHQLLNLVTFLSFTALVLFPFVNFLLHVSFCFSPTGALDFIAIISL